MHHALCFVIMPSIVAIIVDTAHIITKTRPIAFILPPVLIILDVNELIISAKINHLNHCFVKILGKALLRLIFERIRSK